MLPALRNTQLPPWAWTLVALGLSAGLLAYALWPGLAGTSDSVYYLSAARSMAAAGQLRNPDGTVYSFWGPLYPITLAPGVFLKQNWLLVAGQLLSTLGAVALWSWLGWRLLPTSGTSRLYAMVLGFSAPLLVAAKFVWSEPLFELLFAGYVVALYQYHRSARFGWLLAATAVGVLLPLQRTSGLFLLFGIGLGLLLLHDQQRWPLKRVLGHLAGASIGGVLWQLYVWRVGIPIPFVFDPGTAFLLNPMSAYGYALMRWLLPLPTFIWPMPWVFGLLLIGLLVLLSRASRVLPAEFGVVLLTSVVAYIVLHILTNGWSRSAGDVTDAERYLTVLYGPIWLLLLAGGQRLLNRWPILMAALGLFILTYSAARTIRNAQACREMPLMVETASAIN
ncbi:hypothetical protein SAMN06265337_1735 [Hymenobacter gelipurpurascens]|uniref:Dolichyl-phosphate-mannose-protein mannosyltransferase n=1 Tax=Hymenobacter gelipurpurascens TaxID=89968 RepID=A0A212TLF0_9BACT|nr:hypothetical protein [Hymenobacter gelipurpurascens]SNC66805.1 hypothetical protein SAMN06265337_1735 [Hymenobacter gelipurpurascens]